MEIVPHMIMDELLNPRLETFVANMSAACSEANRLACRVFADTVIDLHQKQTAAGESENTPLKLTPDERQLILSMLSVSTSAEVEVEIGVEQIVDETTEFGASLVIQVLQANFAKSIRLERRATGSMRLLMRFICVKDPSEVLDYLTRRPEAIDRLPVIADSVSKAYAAAVSAKKEK